MANSIEKAKGGIAWSAGSSTAPPPPMPDPPKPPPSGQGLMPLGIGADGDEVDALQEILIQLGYLDPSSVDKWRGRCVDIYPTAQPTRRVSSSPRPHARHNPPTRQVTSARAHAMLW